jgi:hypothetical protein
MKTRVSVEPYASGYCVGKGSFSTKMQAENVGQISMFQMVCSAATL